MTDKKKLTPKAELILTLEQLWNVVKVDSNSAPELKVVVARGLVDHARALALLVGEMQGRKKKPKVPA